MTAPDPTTRPPWDLVALGTGGIGAYAARGYPALLLKVGSHRTLIDAGDGTFRQLAQWDSARRLDVIVLTALSVERVGGLATILDNPALRARRRPPLVVGPPGTTQVIEGLGAFMGDGPFVSDVTEVDDTADVSLGGATATAAVIDRGPLGAVLGLRLSEPDAPGRFDVEAAKRLGLKPGPGFSQLLRGETVDGVEPHQVVGPPRPGRVMTVLGPCRPTARAGLLAQGAHGLFVAAPYTDERQEVAIEANLMTGVEAALLATKADTETLALLHLSATAKPGYARREAAQFHNRVVIPFDGDVFTFPLSDNGPVQHTPSSSRGARHERNVAARGAH